MKRLLILLVLLVSLVVPASASAATVNVVFEPAETYPSPYGDVSYPDRYCVTVTTTAEDGDVSFIKVRVSEPSHKLYGLTSVPYAGAGSYEPICVPLSDYEAAGGYGWTVTVKLDQRLVDTVVF